jgi:sec-independent protein translocase protein TatC
MPFMGHIGELRKRLTVVIAVVSVTTVAMYFFADPIYAFLIGPVKDALGDRPVVALRVLDPMMVRFKVALWAGVVLASPVIIWQTLSFFLPALKAKEQKWFMATFVAMLVLFVVGASLCYVVILPPSFAWLIGQSGSIMEFQAVATDLVTVVSYFILGFGVAFQLPVIVFYLVYFGVVPYAKLRENWRVVWVVIVIAAAMITPDWSPVSMGALSLAMVGLYELSMLLVRVVLAKKIAAQKAAEVED